jgi:hypothetical protein
MIMLIIGFMAVAFVLEKCSFSITEKKRNRDAYQTHAVGRGGAEPLMQALGCIIKRD